MRVRRRSRFLAQKVVTLIAVLGMALGVLATPGMAAPQGAPPYAPKTLIYAVDGLRPDLTEEWAMAGDLPNYARFFNEGVTGDNGMVPQFPPNTGAGWTTISTGALPSVSGAVNNTIHIVSNAIVTSTSPLNAGLIQAETIGEVAEKYGKSVAVLDWPGSLPNSKLKGPVVDYRNFYSGRGVIANYEVPGVLPNFVRDFGLNYVTNAAFADASGWTGAPQSYSPAKETTFSFNTNVISGTAATLTWNVYVFDSSNDNAVNYDSVVLARDGKDAAGATTMKAGDWQNVKLNLPQNGLLVGNYVKVIDLAPDLSQFRLYYTSLSRSRSNMAELEQKIATDFPTVTGADFAPIEAGIIDEATYIEQGLQWYNVYEQISQYVISTYNPDLVLAGYPTADEFQHLFTAKATPGTPVYSATDGPKYRDYIKQAYMQADTALGNLWNWLGSNTVTFVGADHGFAPAWKSVNAPQVLQDAGLYDPANRIGSKAGVYVAGGTANIYVNLTGREQGGVVAAADFAAVQQQIMDAFNNLTDGGTKITAGVWKGTDLVNLNLDGYNMPSWHPTRTGDVVVTLVPPYQFDAPTAGQVIADSPFFGQHGYMPDLVDPARGINMHAMFGILGPGVAHTKISKPRSIDIAPTAAYAMNIPVPRHAQGMVLKEAFTDSSSLVPVQVLSWSDYHCQLEPLTETVDGRAVPTGGVARIADMWNRAKAENPNGTIILGSGDEVGATPPSCAFLNDAPAIQAMNAMGFTATAAGNHEFDKGVENFRALKAQANFAYLSNNIINSSTGQLADFATPYIVTKANGIDVGIIGVGNPETPNVTSPKGIEGYSWVDPVAPTNRYVQELVNQGVQTIIVIYHQGSTSTDMDKPTGPIVDFAMQLDPEVDLLVTGHNRRPTMARVNGILVNEGNNTFLTNRFQLMVDPTTKDVVWSYGVFQRPWGGAGVPVDANLAALVKSANDQIQPILGAEVGTSAGLIDRSRGGESKSGNLISDAIRATYQVDVALQNSGGLRADIDAGPVTRAEVFAVLPFGNLVVVGDLKGSDLLAALENGVSDFSGTAGRFVQLSGLRFAYDQSKPVGQRVLWAVLSDGRPVDPNATYRVGANDFMFSGGDGYTALTRMTNVTSQAQLYEVAATYIQSLGTIDPQIEGRIVAVAAGETAPAAPSAATPTLPTPAVGPASGTGPAATTTPGTIAPGTTPTSGVGPAVATPTNVAPGMPRTGDGDNGIWNWLIVLSMLLLAAGVWLTDRRKSSRQA